MSPMTMAILGTACLQGGQAFQRQPARRHPAPAPAPSPVRSNAGLPGGGLGGGLGDLLKGGLGGLLAGGAAGSVISGGLGDLLKQFQQSGHGETANSWVSPRPEQADFARRSRQRARRRSDQQPDVAKRPVARRTARGPQPAFARGDQPSDAGRTAADRKRIGGPALTPVELHAFSKLCFFRKGRQP